MSRKDKIDIATGVIVINKHEGVTSHRIVQILRRLYDTPRIGHTGTLDPMATGVLPILVGRAVKASDFLVSEDKEYIAEMTLGITSDTDDITGEILTKSENIPKENEVFAAIMSFIGEIEQIPPMYSAIKVGGKKLVDLAREGITVERKSRKVKINSIEAEKISENVYKLKVSCSKGTYIRTLCHDIGEKLGCGAVMSALERTRSGGFTLSDSHTVEELENLSIEERAELVMPTEELFSDCPEINVNDFYAKLIRGGTELYQKKLNTAIKTGSYVRIKHNNVFIALGQVADFEGGSAVRPVKLFVL
ncbi:MAG: tRNA pseudouridine(55) synthase TruB [Ruminococcaceae bacterium]|nr:tRNA pseudouridine(55) synthase TruB [Oscillospiraceae bacterium]